MKCRGAVLPGAGKSWEICQIDLDPPRAGEVLVQGNRIAAVGDLREAQRQVKRVA